LSADEHELNCPLVSASLKKKCAKNNSSGSVPRFPPPKLTAYAPAFVSLLDFWFIISFSDAHEHRGLELRP
jgi:hypothetical protein